MKSVHAAAALKPSATACFKGELRLKYKLIHVVVTRYFFRGRVKDKKTVEHKPLLLPQVFLTFLQHFLELFYEEVLIINYISLNMNSNDVK